MSTFLIQLENYIYYLEICEIHNWHVVRSPSCVFYTAPQSIYAVIIWIGISDAWGYLGIGSKIKCVLLVLLVYHFTSLFGKWHDFLAKIIDPVTGELDIGSWFVTNPSYPPHRPELSQAGSLNQTHLVCIYCWCKKTQKGWLFWGSKWPFVTLYKMGLL